MQFKWPLCLSTAIALTVATVYTDSHAATITIATVNNGDMIRMQEGLTDDFTAKTGHEVEWVTLEENVLRQHVTTDISTKGGAFITAMSNSFGARWFNEEWNAQFDTREWSDTLNFFVNMMSDAGPPGYATNGFNENLALFKQGKCGMWIDATVAASFVTNPNDSTVADKVGFALAPDNGPGVRSNWLWAWALAIPAGTQNEATAKEFIEWATSNSYIELVTSKEGWANVPPGARTSLYENPNYKDIPFAQMTLDSILSADPNNSTIDPSPYVGIQFAAIPEFAGIATEVSQEFSAAYAGQQTVEEALSKAQALTNDAMEAAGYR